MKFDQQIMRHINIEVPDLYSAGKSKISEKSICPKIPQACYRSLSINQKSSKKRSFSTNQFAKKLSIQTSVLQHPIWKSFFNEKSHSESKTYKTIETQSKNELSLSVQLKDIIKLKSRNGKKGQQEDYRIRSPIKKMNLLQQLKNISIKQPEKSIKPKIRQSFSKEIKNDIFEKEGITNSPESLKIKKRQLKFSNHSKRYSNFQ